MKIQRFEDIEAWKEARNLNKLVYQTSRKDQFRRDLGLTSQIQRASISVMANIAEGFDRQSDKEFIQYLSIASSSASEIQSHLYAALDLAYIKEEEFRNLFGQTNKVKKLINGFIAYLKSARNEFDRRTPATLHRSTDFPYPPPLTSNLWPGAADLDTL